MLRLKIWASGDRDYRDIIGFKGPHDFVGAYGDMSFHSLDGDGNFIYTIAIDKVNYKQIFSFLLYSKLENNRDDGSPASSEYYTAELDMSSLGEDASFRFNDFEHHDPTTKVSVFYDAESNKLKVRAPTLYLLCQSFCHPGDFIPKDS